jgi:hypothetical protein
VRNVRSLCTHKVRSTSPMRSRKTIVAWTRHPGERKPARAAPGGDTQTGIVLLRKSRRWSAAFPVGAGSYAPAYIEKTHTRDLFGIAVKDRRGSRQSLYLRSLFPPVPSLRFSSAKVCKGYNMESTRQQRFGIQSLWFREAEGS